MNTTMPLVLNIVGAFMCAGTCVGSLACIAGIVFAIQAGQLKRAGDLVKARAKAKTSLNVFIASMAVGALSYALFAIFARA